MYRAASYRHVAKWILPKSLSFNIFVVFDVLHMKSVPNLTPSSSRSQIFLTLLSDKRNCKQLLERKQGSLGVLLRSLAKNLGYLKISLNVIRVKAGKESHTEKFLKTRRGLQKFSKA